MCLWLGCSLWLQLFQCAMSDSMMLCGLDAVTLHRSLLLDAKAGYSETVVPTEPHERPEKGGYLETSDIIISCYDLSFEGDLC